MKFFIEILLQCIATSVYYLPIAKNSQENFRGTLKNHKNLAQQIFPVYGIVIVIAEHYLIPVIL